MAPWSSVQTGPTLWFVLLTTLASGLHQCSSRASCGYNGECDISTRTCHCNFGWTGTTCSTLNVQRMNERGVRGFIRLSDGDATMGATGFKTRSGTWCLWATEIKNSCGKGCRGNMRIVQAISDRAEGPYYRSTTLFSTPTYDPKAILAPSGEIVLFFKAYAPKGILAQSPVCHCGEDIEAVTPINGIKWGECTSSPSDFFRTFMVYKPSESSVWSNPVLIPYLRDFNSSSLSAVILEDGSLKALYHVWEACPTAPQQLCASIASIAASDWHNVTTYRPQSPVAMPVNMNSMQNPFLWRDKSGVYHALLHDSRRAQEKGTCASHAFSRDFVSWTLTGESKSNIQNLYSIDEKAAFCTNPAIIFDLSTEERANLSAPVAAVFAVSPEAYQWNFRADKGKVPISRNQRGSGYTIVYRLLNSNDSMNSLMDSGVPVDDKFTIFVAVLFCLIFFAIVVALALSYRFCVPSFSGDSMVSMTEIRQGEQSKTVADGVKKLNLSPSASKHFLQMDEKEKLDSLRVAAESFLQLTKMENDHSSILLKPNKNTGLDSSAVSQMPLSPINIPGDVADRASTLRGNTTATTDTYILSSFVSTGCSTPLAALVVEKGGEAYEQTPRLVLQKDTVSEIRLCGKKETKEDATEGKFECKRKQCAAPNICQSVRPIRTTEEGLDEKDKTRAMKGI